ncbi:hypothetical protein BST61_g1435 [Cercospora zeina]
MAEVHEVAPDGDVKLICGSEENENLIHIIVSSVVLSLGSPVFKAMLGAHFKEGTTLATGAQLELPLPEDSPRAMLAICEVMHMKSVTRAAPSVDQLVKIVMLVDKYDCRGALNYAMREWIRCTEEIAPGDMDRLHLFVIAYLMELRQDFSKFGYHLVGKSSLSFRFDPPNDIPETLQRAIEMLYESRRQAAEEVQRTFERVISVECAEHENLPGRCADDCTHIAERVFSFISRLTKTQMWPLTQFTERPLLDQLIALEDFPSDWAVRIAPCKGQTYCKGIMMSVDMDVAFEVSEFARLMVAKLPVPCLTCAKEKTMELTERCNKGH